MREIFSLAEAGRLLFESRSHDTLGSGTVEMAARAGFADVQRFWDGGKRAIVGGFKRQFSTGK